MKIIKSIMFVVVTILFFNSAVLSTNHIEIDNDTTISSKTYKNYSQDGSGGVFYTRINSILTVNSSTFTTNTARRNGGAITSYGKLNISSSNFSSNRAGTTSGGSATFGGALEILRGTATIKSSEFNKNQNGIVTLAGYGGAIYIQEGVLDVSSSSFNENKTSGTTYYGKGGAICSIFEQVIMNISSTTFNKNSAEFGGAIYNVGTIKNLTGSFTNNYSSSNSTTTKGGAIYNEGTVNIGEISLFDSNKADHGGAIYNNLGNVTIGENSCFNSNKALNNTSYSKGGAITNVDNGEVIIESGVKFSSNTSQGNRNNNTLFASIGGAIYNGYHQQEQGTSSTLTTKANVIFEYNSAISTSATSLGGAIVNGPTSTIVIGNDNLFVENKAISEKGLAYGGAIYNESNATITLGDNVVFSSNIAQSQEQGARGGAIQNNGKLTVNSNTNFDSNKAIGTGGVAYGGAICNNGTITEIKGNFENNTSSSNLSSAEGGAIYNTGTIGNIEGDFINNSVSGITGARGGAIRNAGTDATIKSIIGDFIGNSVTSDDSAFGGAIRNEGVIEKITGNFLNNVSSGEGGAIFNRGVLNLVADTSNIEFTGNTANGVSNAIFDDGGTINLWANENKNIIFNDRIKSNNTSTLNINSSTNTLTANGKIILNEDISGYTGAVNLYGGEIELQAKTEEGSNVNTNKFFNSSINLSSGTLNILNNSIDNITVKNLTTTSNTNLKFDTDLSNNTTDNFTVTNSATGQLNLNSINILGVDGKIGQITLFNDGKAPTLNILTTGNYGGQEYVFTNSDVAGVLNYRLSGYRTFKETINDSEPLVRSYSLDDNELVTENLGQLGGTQLTIFGNGFEVNGNSKQGISVSEEQILNIEKGTGDSFNWNNFSKSGEGGSIYNYCGNINLDYNIIFSSNISSNCGGAIYNNNGTTNIGSTTFVLNIARNVGANIVMGYGGALYNTGITNINSSLFSMNKAIGVGQNHGNGYGGAIYNDNGTINISSATFVSNIVNSAGIGASGDTIGIGYGGAIYNDNGTINISSATFVSNTANSVDDYGYGYDVFDGGDIYDYINGKKVGSVNGIGYGGAIYNDNGTINISSATFSLNKAQGVNKNRSYGGVIYNSSGTIIITSTIFDSNEATCTNTDSGKNQVGSSYGGVIYNDCGTIIVSSTTFFSNKAKQSFNVDFYHTAKANGYGGVIYATANSTTTFMNGVKFINNYAITEGGAIYNRGTINLIADTDNIEFTGNTSNGETNAIYNGGIINLYVSDNANIIFNDRITSAGAGGYININKSSGTLPTTGKIILNEDMSGSHGTLNLYGGEIELQAKTEEGSNVNTNKFFSGTLNLSSGTLNIQNNAIDNIIVGNALTTTSNTNLKFDVDLSNNTSDNFTVTNSASGELNLSAINILGVNGTSGQITLFKNSKSPTLNILTTANYGGYEYTFTNSDTAGVLNYLLTGYKTLKESVNATSPATRSYSLSEKETVTADLGDLGGTQLTIFGNGYEVDGNGKAGITIGQEQILNIDKGTGENFSWSNFDKAGHGGVFYNNKGTLIVNDDVIFSGNIVNSNASNKNGGAINNNNGFVTLGNNVIFTNNESYHDGGAIYMDGEQNFNSFVNIGTNSTFDSNIANNNGGAIFIDTGKVTINNNSTFYNNTANNNGGAVVAWDRTEINIGYNANFSSNTATNGGAILNESSVINISSNSIFNSNIVTAQGGAISNNSGITTIYSSSTFTNNSAYNGGAISNYNEGTINILDNVVFTSNTANKFGGAILNYADTNNNAGTITIGNDALFKGNIAQTDCGGAIANIGTISIGENAIFEQNSSSGCGGAIYNSTNGNITIGSSVTFKNNTEIQNGGAIYTEGVVTLLDGGTFVNNTANGTGGAINLYNGGIINLIANTNNVEFTGNTANGISNAIHDNNGTINLYASDTNSIIFNDRITSENTLSTLNINKPSGTLPRTGKIVLNEDMSGYIGTVNLYGGEIELQAKTEEGSNINTNKFFTGNIKLMGDSTLNIQNNVIDNITVSNLTSPDDTNLKFDTDLSNNTSDNFTVINNVTGQLNLDSINILGVDEKIGQITLFNDGKAPTLNILTTGNYGGQEYVFTNSDVAGVLNYRLLGYKTFKEVINDNTEAVRSYSLAEDEIVKEDLGRLGGTELTIFGNGYEVNGSSKAGITVGSGQKLNIEKGIGENFVWKNFYSENHGGVINNWGAQNKFDSGIINIDSNTVFSNNTVFSTEQYENILGGAIFDGICGKIYIGSGTVFNENNAINNNGYARGGAIYQNCDDANTENTILNFSDNIRFTSNTAQGFLADGGAIDVAATVVFGNNITFSSNSTNASDMSYGGAIAATSADITIGDNLNLNSNKAESLNDRARGGAIYSVHTNMLVGENANIKFNNAVGKLDSYGGAIYNYNSATHLRILDGAIFSSNTVVSTVGNAYGGAIYNGNGASISLIANTNNVEFTGNTANGISNAIHDNGGTINLWASDNASVIFNDRITSSDYTSILNINREIPNYQEVIGVGRLILNEDMSGYTGQVNLYGGEIELQAKTEEDSNVNTNKFFSGNINLSSGTLNILNNAIDNITVSNFTSTENANLKFDANLNNNTSDNFTVTNTAEGTLNLTAINILGTNVGNGQITLFNNEVSPELNVLTTANYGGYEYTFTNSDIAGVLNYEQTGTTKTFKEVVNDIIPQYRSYSFAGNEIVTENLGQLGGTQLTIFGNGYEVDGNGKAGITIGQEQTLNIEKGVGEQFVWRNFNNNEGGAIWNGGDLEIFEGTKFYSNTASGQGGAIYDYANSTTTIRDNCIFSLNTAGEGGAIRSGGYLNIGSNILFSSNTASNGYYGGGAICSFTEATIGNDVIFSSNTAIRGGAIYSHQDTIIGDNAIFEFNLGSSKTQDVIDGAGGAVMCMNSLTIGKNANFVSNTAGTGGAIWLGGSLVIDEGVKFISNTVRSDGGAIFINDSGCLGYTTRFDIKNGAEFSYNGSELQHGGAIYDNGSYSYTTIDGATFTSNYAKAGGAIYLAKLSSTVITASQFNNNVAISSGGAIYNQKVADGQDEGLFLLSGVTFSSNTARQTNDNGYASGGAIFNEEKTTIDSNANFNYNTAISTKTNGHARGGAIFNNTNSLMTIDNNASFIGNKAIGGIESFGGAIVGWEGSNITIGSNAIFDSNTAESKEENGIAQGGAIYIADDATFTITDGAQFTNNTATTNGGAIYNEGILNLIANTNDVEFTGNTANEALNAIHDNGGVINLWASENADIIFNDRITSDNSSVLNINSSTTTLTANGKIILNEDMSGWVGTTNLYNGNLEITEGNNFINGNFTIHGGTFTANANSIITDFTNNGTVNLTGGTIANNISGLTDGIINIKNNDVTINDDVFVNNNNIKLGTTLKLLNEESLNTSTLTICNGAILNTQNNSTGTINANSIVIEDGANWTYQLDVDLKSAKADNLINIESVGNGSKATIDDIHLLSDKATKTSIQIADNDIKATIAQDNFKIYTTNLSYGVTTSLDSNSNTLLNIEAIGYGGLANAVYDGASSYSVTEDIDYLTKWIEDPIGTTNNQLKGNLTISNISSNNRVLKSTNNVEGLITEGYTLQINNVNLEGFNEAIKVNNANGNLQLTNVKFSSNTGNAVITSSGTVELSGVIFDNTNTTNIDFINDNKLILSGSSTTFTTGVIGKGTTTINGVNINLADAIIEQNKIEINSNGSLTANASNITADIENNSNLIFSKGTNNNYIFGTGTTIIDGEVINSSTIANNVTINSQKQLTTNATNIDGQIENNGDLIFNVGTNDNYIYGDGNVSIEGYVISNSSITQSTVTVASTGKFENNNKLQLIDYINNGTTVNNSTISVSGEYYNVGITTNTNYIKANIYTNKENSVMDNTGIIDADEFNIENGSIFSTSFDNLIIKGDFENDGEVTVKGGEIKNNIIGEGKLIIENLVVNNKDINQSSITINTEATLTNNENITIDQILTNNGQLTNEGNIETEQLNNVANSTITNNSNFTVNKKGQNYGRIDGNGILNINDDFDNFSYLRQNLINISSGTFNNENIVISNGINLQEKAKLMSDASNISGNILNAGNVILTGGENNNWIYGTGTTIINGEVINSSTIVNNVKINETKKLTTSAESINGDILNNGILIINSGKENNNKITGIGKLYINCNLTNNNIIRQKELSLNLNPNIQFANSLNSSDNSSQLSVFTNNSEITVETLNLKDTMLKLTEKGSLAVDNLSSQNSAMDLANSLTQQHNFKTISVTDKLDLAVDVDLKNKTMDTISADIYNEEGNIDINKINIITELKGNNTEIAFTTSTVLKDKITSITTASSNLFKYNVEYNKNAGTLNFSVTAKDNPTMVAGQVANIADGLITQTTVLNQAFSSIDNIRNKITSAKEKGLLYASTADVVFDNSNKLERGLWLRPFYSQESINFDSLSVDNTLTGTLAGIDLVTSENSLVSVYLGYAGSEQKYEDIKVSQTGYIVGATGMLIKDDWYAGLTANINFNKAESQSDYGTDSFDMNMYSVGAKAGYNYEINDKWTLEPNLTLMYGNVNSAEYQTTQGAKVEGQSVANIIVAPQVKAKLGLTNGWQPYGLLGYVINCGDKVKANVEGVEFEQQKIENYFEFGIGINKEFINTPWNCYLQVTGRSGDRSGFDSSLGIKYKF